MSNVVDEECVSMLSSQHHSEPHVYQTNHTRYLFITCIHQTADDDALMHLDVHVRRDKSLYTSTCATGLSTTSLKGAVCTHGRVVLLSMPCGKTPGLLSKVVHNHSLSNDWLFITAHVLYNVALQGVAIGGRWWRVRIIVICHLLFVNLETDEL